MTSYDVASTTCAAPHAEVKLGLAIKDVVPDDQYLYPYARVRPHHCGATSSTT